MSHLKKYANRPSPPYPANECPNQTMTGNDGKIYTSVDGKWMRTASEFSSKFWRPRAPSARTNRNLFGLRGEKSTKKVSRRKLRAPKRSSKRLSKRSSKRLSKRTQKTSRRRQSKRLSGLMADFGRSLDTLKVPMKKFFDSEASPADSLISDYFGMRIIFEAAKNGNVEKINKIAPRVNSTSMHVFYQHGGIKMTALQVASYYGNLEVVKILLAQGLDIEQRDDDEDYEHFYHQHREQPNALWWAVYGGRLKVVDELLRRRANPWTNLNGRSIFEDVTKELEQVYNKYRIMRTQLKNGKWQRQYMDEDADVKNAMHGTNKKIPKNLMEMGKLYLIAKEKGEGERFTHALWKWKTAPAKPKLFPGAGVKVGSASARRMAAAQAQRREEALRDVTATLS